MIYTYDIYIYIYMIYIYITIYIYICTYVLLLAKYLIASYENGSKLQSNSKCVFELVELEPQLRST